MSSSIDERVVSLKMDNKQFEKNANQSIGTLDKLKKSMDVKESSKSLKTLSRASKSVNFSGLEKSLSNIEKRFSAFGIAGMTAIQDVTRFALRGGKQIASYLTKPLEQIKTGGINRAMNIEQATFQLKGMGLAWKEVRQNALDAVKGTAYGLDEAVKVASQLGASGVKAGADMKNSLQGIAGVAAMTGRSYSDIGNIFSTIAGNGKVMTQQLRQLSASGLNASATMAKFFGKTEAEINDLVSKGKIGFDQFNQAMQAAFSKHATEANDTFTGAMSNVKAALSRIGEGPATAGLEGLRKLFVALIPVIDGLNDTLQPFLKDISKLITFVTGFFTALMQNKTVLAIITNLAKSLRGVFKYLGDVFKTVGKAFLDVFPPKSLTQILQVTRGIRDFTRNLKLSEEGAETLRSVARGLFAVFGILKNVLVLVVHVLKDIAKSPVGGFLMKAVKWVSNLLVNIEYFFRVLIAGYDYTVQYFGGLAGVFKNFGIVVMGLGTLMGEGFKKAAEKIVVVFGRIKDAITSLIPGFDTAKQGVDKVGEAAKGVAEKAGKALMGTGDKAKAAASKTADAVKTVGDAAAGVANKTKEAAEKSGQAAQDQAKKVSGAALAAEAAAKGAEGRVQANINRINEEQGGAVSLWGKVLNVITSGITYILKGVTFLWEKLSDVFGWLWGQLGHVSLNDIFNALFAFNASNLIGSITKGFQSIQGSISGFFDSFSKLQSGRIKQIENINKILDNVKNTLGAFQKSIRANMLIKLAVAIAVLAGSILLVSKIKLNELINGLAAVTILMAELLVASAILKKINKDGGIKNSASVIFTLVAVAEAVKILAKAVAIIAQLNIGQIGTALLGIAGALAILITAMSMMQTISAKEMFSVAVSIAEVSIAIKILGSAIKQLGSMDFNTLLLGLASMALALLAIAGFAKLVNEVDMSPKFGFAIIEIALAIKIISNAITTLGSLDIWSLIKGLAGLALALTAIAGFSVIISKYGNDLSPKFGFALIEIGAALNIIAAAVKSIGALNIQQIITGISGIALVLTAIAGFSVIISHYANDLSLKFGVTLILVATALKIISSAVGTIGGLDLASAATGVGSLVVIIGAIAALAVIIEKKGTSIIDAGLAMWGIGAALNNIASGVEKIGHLPLAQISAGTAALVILMREFAEFSDSLNEFDMFDLLGAAVMLPLIGSSINTIANAVKTIGGLSWQEALTGIIGFATVMMILNKAIEKLCEEPSIMKVGYSMYLVGSGILSISTAIATIGKMSIQDVATGLLSFGGSLLILSKALGEMDLSKSSMTSFLLLTLGVAILAAPLILLANLDFAGVAAGLTMFGGSLAILAITSKLLNKQIVPMLKMIGVLSLFAATMLLLAPSFTLMGNIPLAGVAGSLIMIAGSLTILGIAAKILEPRIKAMEKICEVIAHMGKGFLFLATAMGIFALTLAAIAAGLVAKGLAEGLKGIAQGISDAAVAIAGAVKDIVIAIVDALKESIPYLVDSAFEMVLKFIQGCSEAIHKYLPIIMSALGDLLASLAKALKKWFSEFDSVGTDLAIKIGAAVVAILAVIRSIVKSTSALNPKNFKSLLIIAGLIVASIVALYVLAGIPWPQLLSATAAYSATLLSLAGAMKIMATAKFNKKQLIAFAEAIALVVAIGAALYFLAGQPWSGVLASAAGLVACLLAFSAAFVIASSAKPDLKTIALFLLGSLAFVPIATALILVAKQPWEAILSAGAALVACLLAFGAVFAIISLIPVDLASTALFLLGSLAVIPIAIALKMVASSADYMAIAAAGQALAECLLSFGAVFAIMSLIPAAAAANAVASIAVALGGLIGILMVLGALNQIPGFSWLIEEGGKIVKKIGNIIGGFFGAIVSGFAEEAASCLPVVGQSLSEFMTNAEPFFNAVTKLDEGTLECIKTLAESIKTLTEAALLSSIGDMFSFFVGQTAFDSLGENLVKFGHAMSDFSDATSDIVPENISLLAQAAANLATALDVLPKEGGLAQWFSGTTDFNKLGEQLKAFGKAMTEMSTSVSELDLDAVEKVKGAGEMMAAMADAAPKYGGVFQAFTGESDMGRFGREVSSFGRAMNSLSTEITDINLDAVKALKNAGIMMSDMADRAPSYNGAWQLFTGESDLGEFGRQIVSFGTSMVNFSNTVSKLDTSAVRNAAAVGDMLVALVNGLPDSGGVVGWWSGDKDLEDLGEQLVPFGEYLNQFGTSVKTMDHSAIYNAANAMMNMAKLFSTVSDVNASGQVGPFCENMKAVGDAYGIFNGNIQSIDSTKIQTFVDNLKLLLTTFSKKFKTKGVDYKKIAEFSKNIKSLNTAMGFITGNNASTVESFNDSLKQLAEVYTAFAKDIKSVKTTDIKEFVKQIKMLLSAFEKKKGDVKMNFGDLKGFAKNISTIAKASKQLSGSGAGNVESFKSNLESLGKTYKAFAEDIRKVEDTDITNFGEQAKDLNAIAKKLAKTDVKGLKDFGKAISDVGAGGNKAMDKALEKVNKKLNKFTGKGSKIITNMAEGVRSTKAVNKLTKAVTKTLGDANITMHNYRSKFKSAGLYAVNGFVEGFKTNSSLDNVSLAAANIARQAVKAMKKELREKSPSRVTREIGDYATEGFTNGLISGIKDVKNASIEVAQADIEGLTETLQIHSPSLKGFSLGQFSVDGFIQGLKSKAGEVVKASSNTGDSFLSGLMKSLDIKGAINGKKKKDTKNAFDGLGKDMAKELDTSLKKESKRSGGSGGGGGTGHSVANSVEKWANADSIKRGFMTAFIKGMKMTNKMLGKEIGTTTKNAGKLLKDFSKQAKLIDKDLAKYMLRTPKSIVNYTKAINNGKKYIKKFVSDVNTSVKNGLSTSTEVTADVMTSFANSLYKGTKEYKDSMKNIKAYAEELKEYDKLTDKYNDKIDKYRKKKNVKKAKEYLKKLEELTGKVTETRKKMNKEWKKVGEGASKALKKLTKEIKNTLKEIVKFSDFNLEDSRIVTGLDRIGEEVEKVDDGISVLEPDLQSTNDALNDTSDAADKAADAYDGLSASMDTGINLMERFTKTGTVESDALFENADSQLEAYEEFQNGIAELERRNLDMSVVDELASQGPQALAQIRGFLSMSDEQIASYNKRVDKKNEYAVKALERNLKRQYAVWEKYVSDLKKLAARLGENNPVYAAFYNAGLNNADMLSKILGINDDTFDNVIMYIANGIGTGLKELSSTVSSDAQSSGEETATDYVTGMKNLIQKKKDFSTAIADAVKAGLDSSFSEWMRSKGYDTGMSYLNGLKDATGNFDAAKIKEANTIWDEYKEQSAFELDKDIASQVDAQDKNIQENKKLRSNFNDFLTAWAKQHAGEYSQGELQDKIYGYEKAFEVLVKELKEKGLDANDILEALNGWLTDDKDGWGKVLNTLDNITKRSDNNAMMTAEAVKDSWKEKVNSLKERTNALITLTKKFGGKMSMTLFNQLQELDTDALKAMASDAFSEEDLQGMAQEWYDADYASDYLAKIIVSSVATGVTNGVTDARAWMADYAKQYNTKKSGSGDKNDWIYEIGRYAKDALAQGKNLKDIVNEMNALAHNDPEQFKSLFHFNAETMGEAKNYISKFTKFVLESYKQNLNDEDIINELLSSNNSIKNFVGEKILGGILQSGLDNKDFIKGIFTDPLKTAAEQISSEVKDPQSEIGQTISRLQTITSESFTRYSSDTITTGSNAMSSGLKTMSKKSVDICKPNFNSNGAILGKETDKGIATAVYNNKNGVTTKVKSVSNTARNQSKTTYNNDGQKLGLWMAEGIAKGIKDNASIITDAAKQAAKDAYDATMETIEAGSPSKLFMKVGRWVDEGFAIGIRDNTNTVTDAVGGMAESTLNGMLEAIRMTNDAINGDLELSPTITPTLDLSLVNRQANRAGGLFNSYFGLKAAINEEAINQNEDQNPAKSVTFVQNNYSPKALDRLEIYRQTNNQFAMARKAVTGNA